LAQKANEIYYFRFVGKRMQFIIIDDDEVFQFTTKRLLEKSGVEKGVMKSFFSAEDALDYCQKMPDNNFGKTVILLDINLPGMDGWAFLEEWRKLPKAYNPHLFLFMISSSINKDDRDRAVATDVIRDYYTKPLTLDAIKQLLNSVTDNP
jgi:CheY-like chemotaxis protein